MYNMYKVARSEAVGLIRVKLVVCMIVYAVCRIGSPSMSRLRWNRWCAMRSWGEPGLSLSSGVAQADWVRSSWLNTYIPVSYTHLRAHETDSYLVCRLLLEKKKKNH